MYATIKEVIRNSDKKVFCLDDMVFIDDIFQGTIVGFNQFEDDFRVCVDDGTDDFEEGTYFSITEID